MTKPDKHYLLIGAGGTGAMLFSPLLRLLETWQLNEEQPFSLSVIDGKAVSETKLLRQNFLRRFINANKAEALLAQYETDPKVVFAIPEYIGDLNINVFRDNDTVLIAADNWTIRQRIEGHCANLDNITVINGGNEMFDGSVQLWMRRRGKDITPPLSTNHPEILEPDNDMSAMTCAQIAELPSGEQTLIANMMSATAMLNALRLAHDWDANAKRKSPPPSWNEAYFDMNTFAMRSDNR